MDFQGASARQLDNEFEALVHEARNLPGFARFMLHETYDTISDAAGQGPVVVLIPGSLECYAIIIPAQHTNPLHVSMDISKGCLVKLCNVLRTFGQCRRDLNEEPTDRSMKVARPDTSGRNSFYESFERGVSSQ